MGRLSGRDGYALLAVLWIAFGASALAFAVSMEAKAAVDTGRNRVALAKAEWAAEGCMAVLREVATRRLQAAITEGSEAVRTQWNRLNELLAEAPAIREAGCRIAARPLGARVALSTATPATVRRLLRQAVVPEARADSLAAAIVAWRQGMDRPIRSLRELRTISGFDAGLDTLFDLEPAPISLHHASPAVLALVPGLDAAAADTIVRAVQRGRSFASFLALTEALSPESRARLDQDGTGLAGAVSLQTPAWLIELRAARGQPPITAVIETRIGFGGTGIVIEGRRSWVE